MILHFMNDEKFIDAFIDQFNKTHPDQSVAYYVIVPDTNGLLKHVKSPDVLKVYLNKKSLKQILRAHEEIEIIYLHNFPKNTLSVFRVIPNEIRIGWIFYGTEVYKNMLSTNILDRNSENIYPLIFKKHKRLLKFAPNFLVKQLLITREKVWMFKLNKLLQRINYFCHWNRFDYDRIKELFPKFKAQFIEFGYNYSFSAHNNVDRINHPHFIHGGGTKGTIMVGHGANLALNHLTIFEHLRNFDGNEFNIICPLSYGDMDYKALLLEYFHKNNLLNINVIHEFMSFQEYVKQLSQIDVLVMNNIRNQGGSNIALALDLGKKVYMNARNTNYLFYKKLGFIIYSTEEFLRSHVDEILTPLEPEQRNINYEKIHSLPVMSIQIYSNLP